MLLFVVYPAGNLLWTSFFRWDGVAPVMEFVGLSNYAKMFTGSPELWLSLRNNGIYFVIHMLAIPVELLAATVLNSRMRGAGFYKAVVFLPFIISGVGISYAFAYFFSPVNGAFDAVLRALGLGHLVRGWLSDPEVVNYVLAAVSLWRFSGYHIVLFISGLQSIPQELLEAAEIDGASAWQRFRYIQVPSIHLMLDFILFDCMRGCLQHFEIPFIMTSGGPGYASSTFTLYTVDTAFKFHDFGLASTMAVAIMGIVLLVHLLQNRLMTRLRGGDGK